MRQKERNERKKFWNCLVLKSEKKDLVRESILKPFILNRSYFIEGRNVFDEVCKKKQDLFRPFFGEIKYGCWLGQSSFSCIEANSKYPTAFIIHFKLLSMYASASYSRCSSKSKTWYLMLTGTMCPSVSFLGFEHMLIMIMQVQEENFKIPLKLKNYPLRAKFQLE